MAGTTGLEPAAPAVTGQRSNQLNYVPRLTIRDLLKSLAGSGVCRFRIQRTVCLPCPVQRLFPAERPINRPIELRLAWLVTKTILPQPFASTRWHLFPMDLHRDRGIVFSSRRRA